MIQDKNHLNYFFSSIVEYLAVVLIFFISVSLLVESSQNAIVQEILIDSCVVSLSLHISRHFLFFYRFKFGPLLDQMIKNALGLLLATVMLLAFTDFFRLGVMTPKEIILASTISFFVLGTLTPLLSRDSSNSF